VSYFVFFREYVSVPGEAVDEDVVGSDAFDSNVVHVSTVDSVSLCDARLPAWVSYCTLGTKENRYLSR